MDPITTPITPSETLTIAAAAYNAAAAFITIFLVLLVYGYKQKGDDFDMISWALEQKNRFLVGIALIVGFSLLTIMTPDLSGLFQQLGFNIEAKFPVSLGLGLAAFLIGGLKKNEVK